MFNYLLKLCNALLFSKKRLEKEKASKFGVIRTSIFYYVTPTILFVLAVVVGLVFYGWSSLYRYFETNVPLNSLILSILFFAVARAIYNNFLLWRSSGFMVELDALAEIGNVSSSDIKRMQHLLHTKGFLMDIKQMKEVVDKIKHYGRVQFTDNEARLVKSKFGYRARLNMSGVGFLAGMLVMLGLLGTFLGLLKTIDSVGEAMSMMSSMGDGDVDMEEQMSGFISSLSAPLQGMGLAFSSSLFGLSGSLLIGFINFLCGKAQNKFIEDVSRWIDEHIPKPTNKMQELAKNKELPAGDDLKAWLASFVFLSNRMNKRMEQLFTSLAKAESNSTGILQYTELMCNRQLVIDETLLSINQNLKNNGLITREGSNKVASKIDNLNTSLDNVNIEVSSIRKTTGNFDGHVTNITNSLDTSAVANQNFASQIQGQQEELKATLDCLRVHVLEMSSGTRSFENTSLLLNDTIKKMNKVINTGYLSLSDGYVSVENVSLSLNETIKEMNKVINTGYLSLSDGYVSVENLLKSQENSAKISAVQNSEMKELLSKFVEEQSALIFEISGIKSYLKNSKDKEEMYGLVNQMSVLVDKMKKNNSIFNVFSKKDKTKS